MENMREIINIQAGKTCSRRAQKQHQDFKSQKNMSFICFFFCYYWPNSGAIDSFNAHMCLKDIEVWLGVLLLNCDPDQILRAVMTFECYCEIKEIPGRWRRRIGKLLHAISSSCHNLCLKHLPFRFYCTI